MDIKLQVQNQRSKDKEILRLEEQKNSQAKHIIELEASVEKLSEVCLTIIHHIF